MDLLNAITPVAEVATIAGDVAVVASTTTKLTSLVQSGKSIAQAHPVAAAAVGVVAGAAALYGSYKGASWLSRKVFGRSASKPTAAKTVPEAEAAEPVAATA